MLDLGLIGAVVFSLGLLTMVRQVMSTARHGAPSIEILWPLAFIAFLLVESVAESVLVRPNSGYWILYVFTAASAARMQHQYALRDSEGFIAPMQSRDSAFANKKWLA